MSKLTDLIINGIWKVTDEIVVVEEEFNPRIKIHQIHQIQCIRISSIWRDNNCSTFVEMLYVAMSIFLIYNETGHAPETTGAYKSEELQ